MANLSRFGVLVAQLESSTLISSPISSYRRRAKGINSEVYADLRDIVQSMQENKEQLVGIPLMESSLGDKFSSKIRTVAQESTTGQGLGSNDAFYGGLLDNSKILVDGFNREDHSRFGTTQAEELLEKIAKWNNFGIRERSSPKGLWVDFHECLIKYPPCRLSDNHGIMVQKDSFKSPSTTKIVSYACFYFYSPSKSLMCDLCRENQFVRVLK
nr:hypothetical protein Iba_chr03aCG1330 [Ipomoea batatas]